MPKSIARSVSEKGQALLIEAARVDRGAVKVKGKDNSSLWVPLIKPWPLLTSDGHPIEPHGSDVYLRCALRRQQASPELRELFGLSEFVAWPGFQFFTSHAVLHFRVPGRFCVGPDPFSDEVDWGPAEASVLVYRPQVPA